MHFEQKHCQKYYQWLLKQLSKILPGLATGVLKSLGSFGMDKILGQGAQTGGFVIPQNKIDQLIAYKHLLTAKQKHDILEALQTRNGVLVKPTKTQSAGVIETVLASIGIQYFSVYLLEKDYKLTDIDQKSLYRFMFLMILEEDCKLININQQSLYRFMYLIRILQHQNQKED